MKTKGRFFLGVKHAAAQLDLSEASVKRLANLGEIPCLRDSSRRRLFDPDEIERVRIARAERNAK